MVSELSYQKALDNLRDFSTKVDFAAAPFLTFLIDKRNGVPSKSGQILPFFREYNLFDRKNNLFLNPFMRNSYENEGSCIRTIDHFRQPRKYGCWNNRDTKVGCDNTSCKYHPTKGEVTIFCNFQRDVIWKRDNPDAPLTLGKNYIKNLATLVLRNERIPLVDLLTVLYKNYAEINDDTYERFVQEFNLNTSELASFFTSFGNLNCERPAENQVLPPKSKEVNSPETLAEKYTLQQFCDETGFSPQEIEYWKKLLERKKQVIFQGPPGTGKTFVALRLAKLMISGTKGLTDTVQFHPAYSYEDFIQGYFPNPNGGSLEFALKYGRFIQFCDKAKEISDGSPCVLVIDEINRANLARVFGELMYLLEYRSNEIPLAAGGKPFRIPENVLIIGTMNTADRSIALVDHALRRRFAFVRLRPQYAILNSYLKKYTLPADSLVNALKQINNAIDDVNYEIGTSFFMKDGDQLKTLLSMIWQTEIEPYIEEYFYDQPNKAQAFCWNSLVKQDLKDWV